MANRSIRVHDHDRVAAAQLAVVIASHINADKAQASRRDEVIKRATL
jgi:hypothetical protein